ncbi:MAG: hypothetical protein ACR2K5_16460 [Pseudolabrys sp.]
MRGVGSCAPSDLEAMRHAAFVTVPLKEVGIVGRDGQTLCTHLGLPLGELLASEKIAGADSLAIEVMQIGDGGRMVRLRREGAGGVNDIAALVSPNCSCRRFPLKVAR